MTIEKIYLFIGTYRTVLLYCLALFLLLNPPFYAIPIKNELFSSHILAYFIVIVILLYTFLRSDNLKISNNFQNILLSLHFLTQSISIINAINLMQFILTYKNIVLGMAIYCLTLLLINTNYKMKLVVTTLIASFFIMIFLNAALLIRITIFKEWFLNFFTTNISEYVSSSLEQGKLFFQAFLFCLIPLLIYLFSKIRKMEYRAIYLLLLILTIYIADLTNFRVIFIVTFLGFTIGAFLYNQTIKRYLLIIFILTFLASSYFSIGSINRIIYPLEPDFQNIVSRIEFWNNAYMLGSSRVLGIGLGNYFDNLPALYKNSRIYQSSYQREWTNTVLKNPHNIIFNTYAETGLLGLFFFLVLLISYFVNDVLKKNNFDGNNINKPLKFSFWLLLIFGLSNPTSTIQFWTIFFLLRGLIVRAESV